VSQLWLAATRSLRSGALMVSRDAERSALWGSAPLRVAANRGRNFPAGVIIVTLAGLALNPISTSPAPPLVQPRPIRHALPPHRPRRAPQTSPAATATTLQSLSIPATPPAPAARPAVDIDRASRK